MSWETVTLVVAALIAVVSLIGFVFAGVVSLSFVRRIKAGPAKGKAKTKEKAADEGYVAKDQSILAELVERMAILEADTTHKLDGFDRRLYAIRRAGQDGTGRSTRSGGNSGERDGDSDQWERVDSADPDVAAAIAAGEYVTPDGQPATIGAVELPRQLPGSKEERLATLREKKRLMGR